MTIFILLPSTAASWIMIFTLAMTGFFIYGPQALIRTAAANQATTRAAATANGVTGLFGYASGFVSGVGVGFLVDTVNKINPDKSWEYVFISMVGIAILCTFVFLLMWKAKADGYDYEREDLESTTA